MGETRENKKVLFLTSVFSNLTGGTKYNKNFIEIMINSKFFDVDIKTDKDYGFDSGMRWFNALKAYKSLAATCSHYDIVIIDSSKCKQVYFYINKMRRQNPNTKFIGIHHHYDFHTLKGWRREICKHIELKFLNKMDYIIYASEYTYGLKDKYIKKNVKNILLKVPVKQYNSNKTEWKGNQFTTIGGTGYGKRKGHHLMVEALDMQKDNLKDFCLKIIGNYSADDINIANVENRLTKLNLRNNVVYTGREVFYIRKFKVLRVSFSI